MSYEQILYEVDDPVATITLNRPEFLNAFTNQMGVELRHAVGEAERDPKVVGIIITGAGRGFCAGADMKMLSGISEDSAGSANDAPVTDSKDVDAGDPSWGDDLRGTYTYLMSVPKPIIAAINGPIAGMAVPIALACDLRFMATDAVLTVAFSQRGLVAEWGIGWLLPRIVGSGAALDLLFSFASRRRRRVRETRAGQPGGRRRRGRGGQDLRERTRRAMLTDVARDHEAAGVSGLARRPRPEGARSTAADGRELRPS